MAINSPHQQYQQNLVMTASPEDLTFMLYNGAVKHITLAKLMLDQKNIQEAHNSNIRAQAILGELNATLNMDYEISLNLRQLYTFIISKLVEANIKKDTEMLDEVLPLVKDLRDTWKEAMKQAKITKRSFK